MRAIGYNGSIIHPSGPIPKPISAKEGSVPLEIHCTVETITNVSLPNKVANIYRLFALIY